MPGPTLDELVARMRTRFAAFDAGDTAQVFSVEALVDVSLLPAASLVPGGVRVHGFMAMVDYFLRRYLALPTAQDGPELDMLLTWCELLREADPDLVPIGLDRWLTEGRGRDPRSRAYRGEILVENAIDHLDEERLPILLDKAVAELQAASRPGLLTGADRFRCMANLGTAFGMRYSWTGADADFAAAVAALKEAASLGSSDQDDMAKVWKSLANLCHRRCGDTGTEADFDERIVAFQKVREEVSAEDPQLANYLVDLAEQLQDRFDRTGARGDLDEAVTVQRELLEIETDDEERLLSRQMFLALTLKCRFEWYQDPADIEAAVDIARGCLASTAAQGRFKTATLSELGSLLRLRSEAAPGPAMLDEAIALQREALDEAGTGDDRSVILAQLGLTLQRRAERTGGDGLDDAIGAYRSALELADSERAHARTWGHLGLAYRSRFERSGEPEDLEAAIDALRRAGDDSGTRQDRRTQLTNLGSTLRMRFERFGNGADLDESVELLREAVALAPADGRESAGLRSNLANSLHARFGRYGDPEDKAEAERFLGVPLPPVLFSITRGMIEVDSIAPETLALQQYEQADRAYKRYLESGVPAGLDAAIDAFRSALEYARAHVRLRSMLRINLALRLQMRAIVGRSVQDYDESISIFRELMESNEAAVDDRMGAAIIAAVAESRVGGVRTGEEAEGFFRSALAFYEYAMRLLPLVASHDLVQSDRLHRLENSASSIARDAASVAIRLGEPVRALGLLEQGRGVLWSQLLDLRGDRSDLAAVHPGIAAELERAIAVLSDDGSSHRDRIEAGQSLDEAVDRVRALEPTPGFPRPERFLLPPEPAALLPPGGTGPVVILNVGRTRCDALIVDHDGVSAVSLLVTMDEVEERTSRYLQALHEFAGPQRRFSLEMATRPILEWLWDRIAEPVLDALGYEPGASGDLPRMWWCPTGPLGLLPIHAAGHHAARDGRTVLDRAVSSYTPTLRALANARKERTCATPAKMLVVALSVTPSPASEGAAGFAELPGAAAESRLLADLLPDSGRTLLPDDHATRDAILGQLAAHRWAHLSCHGVQDLRRPDRGGLVPFDWETDGLVRAVDFTGSSLDGGEFAFLSACQTATGGVVNADEAVNLAAAMHYAGWRHVIGTLWTVYDHVASELAARLYDRMIIDGGLDSSASARHLHDVVRELRDRAPGDVTSWARFVHIGP